jgi:hypothetical protein
VRTLLLSAVVEVSLLAKDVQMDLVLPYKEKKKKIWNCDSFSERERRMEEAKQTGRYFTYRRRICAVDFYMYLRASITRAIERCGP